MPRGGPANFLSLLGVACLAGLLFFARLGGVGLFDADEPAYAVAAREMWETGDWVTPTFNGQPRFDKPILFYYLIVLAYAAFGVNEFALRWWPALAGVLLTALVWALGRRHVPAAAGTAAVAFLLSPLTWVIGRAGVTDMLLALFLTGCLALAYAALAAEDSRRCRRALLGAAACSAAAVLVKGPIGVLLPGLILGAYAALTGQLRRALRLPGLLPAGALFLAAALPWYVLVLRANGWAFIEGFVVKHHVVRYTGEISGHGQPFWYFVPVVLVAFFPWSAFLPGGLARVAGRWRGEARGAAPQGRGPAASPSVDWLRFCAVWFGVTFLFFSGARTKLPSYLFPAFPAMAFLVADWLGGEEVSRRAWRAAATLLAGLGLALAVGAAAIPRILLAAAPRVPALAETPYAGRVHLLLAAVFAAGTLAGTVAAWRGRRRAAAVAVATMMLVLAAVLVRGVLPLAHAYVQGALQALVLDVRERLGPDGVLVVYGFNAPSVVFYAGRRVTKVERGDHGGLRRALDSSGRICALARTRDVGDLAGRTGVFPLAQRGGYGVYCTGSAR